MDGWIVVWFAADRDDVPISDERSEMPHPRLLSRKDQKMLGQVVRSDHHDHDQHHHIVSEVHTHAKDLKSSIVVGNKSSRHRVQPVKKPAAAFGEEKKEPRQTEQTLWPTTGPSFCFFIFLAFFIHNVEFLDVLFFSPPPLKNYVIIIDDFVM
jgi:hypothetical protein